MTKKTLSTFEREMQNASFKEQFDEEYNEFVLSETIRTLMEKSHKTVRKLANESGLSTTAIQNMRSGLQEEVKLGNFINISHACGYSVILEKNDERITL
jgi:DNA-binding Xre family transcriptional regulator